MRREARTAIITSPDCGNSPKNLFVQELSIALALLRPRSILRSVSEDLEWSVLGQSIIRGRTELVAALQRMTPPRALQLSIHHALTHGTSGAVNGTLMLSRDRSVQFCDIYEFTSAKGTCVRRITSYRVEA